MANNQENETVELATSAAVFSMAILFVMMAIYLGLRAMLGFDGDAPGIFAVMSAASLPLAILLSWPAALAARVEPHIAGAWVCAATALLLLGVIAAAWALPPFWARATAQTVLLVVLGVEAMALRRVKGAWRNLRTAAYMVAAGVACLALLIWTLRNKYATPFTYEEAMVGLAHDDTMFHISIANMVGGFGAVSNGVDGFAPLAYHVFSHLLIWSVSVLSGVTTIDGYPIFVMVVGVPLLLGLTVIAALLLGRSAELRAPWVVGALSIAIILQFSIADWRSYYISESQLVALIFFILIIILISSVRSVLSMRAAAFLAILVAVISLSKISTGVSAAALCGAFFLAQDRRLSPKTVIKGGLVGAAFIAVFVASGFSGSSDGAMFKLGAFLRSYPGEARHLLLFAALGAASAIGLMRVGRAVSVVFSLTVALLVAMTLTMVLDIAGGAVYYFAISGIWCALLLMAAGLAALLQSAGKRVPLLIWAPMVLALVPALQLVGGIGRAVEAADARIARIDARLPPDGTLSLAARARQDTALAMIAKTVRQVVQERGAPVAVMIAPEFSSYWRRFQAQLDPQTCWSAAFQQAAATGMPSLFGLPPQEKGCEVSKAYGLADLRTGDVHSRRVSAVEVCRKLAAMNLSAALAFKNAEDFTLIDCDASGRRPGLGEPVASR